MSKTAVLIVNLGTPDSFKRSDVARYLKEFLMDRRVIDIPNLNRNLLVRGIIVPFRSGKSAKAYEELWDEQGSPLKYYGENLVEKVQELLGGDYLVELAMRYQNPSIKSSLNKLLKQNVKKLIVFTLFPQYASATVGSVMEEVMDHIKGEWTIPNLTFISEYHDHPGMINLFVNNGKKFDLDSYDHILFSFHGVPERQLTKADQNHVCLQSENCCAQLNESNYYCYSAQCFSTARAIAKALSLSDSNYSVTFQSRLGKTPWRQPYTEDTIKALANGGAKRVLVFSPAFTADCLETIIEIGDEYNELFAELGGEKIDLVPSLNDSDEWASVVKDIILAS